MKGPSRSFFERAPDAPCRRGRILLISYHFPPGRAAGALRWRKLARHAFERGWGLDVLTLDPADLDPQDPASLDDLPDGIRLFGVADAPMRIERLEDRLFDVYRKLRPRPSDRLVPPTGEDPGLPSVSAPTPSPATPRVTSLTRDEAVFSATSPRAWARAYWSLVDFARGARWARRVVALGHEIFQPGTHRIVISCGPPHMSHEAARRLARNLGLPMAMDLRDPWSLRDRVPEGLASPLHFWLARRYERRAIRRAALVTMNTEPARRAMQQLHPDHAERILAVPNAYDERPLLEVDRDRRFLIAYAGTIYLDRTPSTLFKAAARLVRELSLEPEDFALEFMGHLGDTNGESVEEIAAREGLSAYVRTHPPADYATAERFMAGASILVSLPQDSHLAIPSKIFDYMRFEARLLVLAQPESATAEHLRDSGADVVAPMDVEGVLQVLREAHRQHLAGERPLPIARDPRYSRRAAANRIFGAIDEILGERQPIGTIRGTEAQ